MSSDEQTIRPAEFEDLQVDVTQPGSSQLNPDFLLDIPLEVRVVLGESTRTVKEIMDLAPGAVVELDKGYGEPVDLYLNGRLVGHGEVVVVGDQFSVKVSDLVQSSDDMAEALTLAESEPTI